MNGRTLVTAAAALLVLGALAACGGKQPDKTNAGAAAGTTGDAAVQITPEARQEAQQIFGTRCATCHGPSGHGDGPGSAALTPKPRNYHNQAWQDSVTDKEIETAIVYGGSAVGRSPMMIGNPDLGSKPAVVAALREIVRNFGKQP